MSQEIATGTFYFLVTVTLVLQIIMWYKRDKFLRTIKTDPDSKIEKLGTMLRTVIPVRLPMTPNGQFENLRRRAVKVSNYWIVSLLLTFIVPIILFNFTK